MGIVSRVSLDFTALQHTFPDRSRAERPCGKHYDVLHWCEVGGWFRFLRSGPRHV